MDVGRYRMAWAAAGVLQRQERHGRQWQTQLDHAERTTVGRRRQGWLSRLYVYGFEWGKDELKFYLDGVLLYSVENTHWHQPLRMIFDSESSLFADRAPDAKDLPSTFSIEYVRAWKEK